MGYSAQYVPRNCVIYRDDQRVFIARVVGFGDCSVAATVGCQLVRRIVGRRVTEFCSGWTYFRLVSTEKCPEPTPQNVTLSTSSLHRRLNFPSKMYIFVMPCMLHAPGQ
jgi:hypothetical protein